jgi:hypothetical protein
VVDRRVPAPSELTVNGWLRESANGLGVFGKMVTGNYDMADLPIVCTLSPDALHARRRGLLSSLLRRAERQEELPDGLRLRFPPSTETLAAVTSAVEAERHCCRFLRFGITVEPDGGPIVLELSGPPGTREFVAALLEA